MAAPSLRRPCSIPGSKRRECLHPSFSHAPAWFVTDDDVAICIPDSKQKPVVTYNYLSGNARKAVAECIEDTFRLQLWRDLADIELCQCTLLSAVRAWCEANGIDVEYDYTLKMRFQRMRNSYLKHGIDLRRRSRVRDNKNC